MDKRLYPPFHNRGELGITKNYRSITLTYIAAKIYIALLINQMKSEIKKILWKYQNGLRGNRSIT